LNLLLLLLLYQIEKAVYLLHYELIPTRLDDYQTFL